MSSVASVPEMTAAERTELDWLLGSGVLGRSTNAARVLRYICEETFAGRAEQIKEYSIAVGALGRRADFDPQTDTIVRVTVHTLRKRLQEFYDGEGAGRPVRVFIPPGHYVPSFLPNQPSGEDRGVDGDAEAVEPRASRSAGAGAGEQVWWWTAGMAVVLLLAAAATWGIHRHRASVKDGRGVESTGVVAPLTASEPQELIRTVLGNGRKPFVDSSGLTWSPSTYCHGGNSVPVVNQKIAGTEDSYLYLGGVRGIVHCIFPVKRGVYEMRFHFAETSDLEAATRVAELSVNAEPNIGVDVVDEAGGDGIAMTTVATGVAPELDGAIHLDFTSEVSPLNAVEILPAPSNKLLPVRIVAASSPWTDSEKQVWLTDRYFSGGRHGNAPEPSRLAALGMYGSNRVGRFHYDIPAVPLGRYRVRLYFREPWFGSENQKAGGPGSRVFDVTCNGTMLLKDFDILAEGHGVPLVKTFDHVQATAAGRIELYFMPVINYAAVNAIEIVPEA
jgi:Malectin domain